jgi:hypothetical protein
VDHAVVVVNAGMSVDEACEVSRGRTTHGCALIRIYTAPAR